MVVAGLLWPRLYKLPWGRLPGDISIERPGFSFHFPLTTSLVISVVLSLLIWWLWRRNRFYEGFLVKAVFMAAEH